MLERLARAIDELAGLRPRLRQEAEADLVQLALAIARRVLRREIAVDPEALHGPGDGGAWEIAGAGDLPRPGPPGAGELIAECLRKSACRHRRWK